MKIRLHVILCQKSAIRRGYRYSSRALHRWGIISNWELEAEAEGQGDAVVGIGQVGLRTGVGTVESVGLVELAGEGREGIPLGC